MAWCMFEMNTFPIDVLVDSHAGKLCEITQMHNETRVLAISNVTFPPSKWGGKGRNRSWKTTIATALFVLNLSLVAGVTKKH